ncbi:MAG: orotidine 5'-phosphate decarboxylase, partial [Proteobacteria bacterium]|nr:orotidine 5'-phosphate decarboxylase [Pseudomonadota bacterium]
MSETFQQRLGRILNRGLLCVGLDPDPAKLPADLAARPDALLAFNRRIIDATADIAAA